MDAYAHLDAPMHLRLPYRDLRGGNIETHRDHELKTGFLSLLYSFRAYVAKVTVAFRVHFNQKKRGTMVKG